MKKLLSFILCCMSILAFTFPSSAEQNVNLMSAYDKVPWQGDTVYYESDYGTLSFRGESGMSSVIFPTEDSLGMWFYFDIGNLLNKGTGYVGLDFLGADNSIIKSYTITENSGNGNFNRYELGSKDEYLLIPQNTENIRITLYYVGGKQSPYFRNFSLILSNDKTVNADLEWDISGKLQIVQVGVTREHHITWIIIVLLVIVTFIIIRKRIDSIKKIK